MHTKTRSKLNAGSVLSILLLRVCEACGNKTVECLDWTPTLCYETDGKSQYTITFYVVFIMHMSRQCGAGIAQLV
jgi:hypothetical protein